MAFTICTYQTHLSREAERFKFKPGKMSLEAEVKLVVVLSRADKKGN